MVALRWLNNLLKCVSVCPHVGSSDANYGHCDCSHVNVRKSADSGSPSHRPPTL